MRNGCCEHFGRFIRRKPLFKLRRTPDAFKTLTNLNTYKHKVKSLVSSRKIVFRVSEVSDFILNNIARVNLIKSNRLLSINNNTIILVIKHRYCQIIKITDWLLTPKMKSMWYDKKVLKVSHSVY